MILLVTGLLPFLVELCLGNDYINLAVNKHVYYGNIKEGIKESWANDGIINKNCFVSKESGDKYWEVNLGIPSLISDVEIYSENDPNELRLITIKNSVKETKTLLTGKSCAEGCKIHLNKEVSKIRIEKVGPTALNLCEVKAFGKYVKMQATDGPQGASTDSGSTGDSKKRANSIEMSMFTHLFIISIMILITRCM